MIRRNIVPWFYLPYLPEKVFSLLRFSLNPRAVRNRRRSVNTSKMQTQTIMNEVACNVKATHAVKLVTEGRDGWYASPEMSRLSIMTTKDAISWILVTNQEIWLHDYFFYNSWYAVLSEVMVMLHLTLPFQAWMLSS